MIVSVVMSSATRVPCFSFDLSTLERHPTTYLGPEDAFTMTARISLPFLCKLYHSGKVTRLTSFLVELFQHLSNDLADTLKGFDIFLCHIKLFL
jgi:hypothetical protein